MSLIEKPDKSWIQTFIQKKKSDISNFVAYRSNTDPKPKGKFLIDTKHQNTLLTFITDFNFKSQTYCLAEQKTKYFILIFDFDYKKPIDNHKHFAPLYEYDLQVITDYLISLIIASLQQLTTGVSFDYIYCSKNINNGIHLYFPHIIVDTHFCLGLRNLMLEQIKQLNKFPKISMDLWNDILDKSIYSNNSAFRMLYNALDGAYYKVDLNKSTYKPVKTLNKIDHLRMTRIQTNETCFNFSLKNDEFGTPVYLKYVTINKSTKTKSAVTKIKNNNDIEIFELPIDMSLCNALMDNLSIDRLTDYKSWYNFCRMCVNYGLTAQAIKHSKKAITKYDENTDQFIHNMIGSSSDKEPLTINSLFYWSFQDNPEKHKLILERHRKIVINHSDDFLLYGCQGREDFKEATKFISSKALNSILKTDKSIIILHSGTGTGKTHTTNLICQSLIKNNSDASIISGICRRTMIPCHKKAMSTLKFISYLDPIIGKIYEINRLIISLENIHRAKDKYNIVILDEFNSLITNFYSSTMAGRRTRSMSKLIKLIKEADKIIICDATITSMCYHFLDQVRGNDCFVYRNIGKSKKNIPMDVYTEIDDKCLEVMALKIIDSYKTNKSAFVISDSKMVCHKLFNFISTIIDKNDIYLVTADLGNLLEIEECNERWIGKIVISSPKIIFAVDVLIKYDCVYCLFVGKSLNSLQMVQQNGRCRNTDKVIVLLMGNNFGKDNYYVDYEYNKKIEEYELNKYLTYFDKKSEKQEAVIDLCSSDDDIDYNRIFTKIHMFYSWLNRCFGFDKAPMFLKLCEEQGYSITFKKLEYEPPKTIKRTIPNFNRSIKKICDGIIDDMSKQDIIIKDEKEIDDINKKTKLDSPKIKTIKLDSIESRISNDTFDKIEKRIIKFKVTKQKLKRDPMLAKIIKDDKEYHQFIKGLSLFYSDEKLGKIKDNQKDDDFDLIAKNDKFLDKIQVLKQIEKIYGINERFKGVPKIANDDVDRIRNDLLMIMSELIILEEYKRSKQIKIDCYTNKVNKITSIDQALKFLANSYDGWNKFMIYDFERIRTNGEDKYRYINFRLNNKLMKIYAKYLL